MKHKPSMYTSMHTRVCTQEYVSKKEIKFAIVKTTADKNGNHYKIICQTIIANITIHVENTSIWTDADADIEFKYCKKDCDFMVGTQHKGVAQ